MTHVTQTSQFAALKRVLWYMEKRKETEDRLFPDNSYNVLKRYVEEQEREAAIEFRRELIISEMGTQHLHASNVPAGHSGE